MEWKRFGRCPQKRMATKPSAPAVRRSTLDTLLPHHRHVNHTAQAVGIQVEEFNSRSHGRNALPINGSFGALFSSSPPPSCFHELQVCACSKHGMCASHVKKYKARVGHSHTSKTRSANTRGASPLTSRIWGTSARYVARKVNATGARCLTAKVANAHFRYRE